MSDVLARVRPLAHLLSQANDPTGLADDLVNLTLPGSGCDGAGLTTAINRYVTDTDLTAPALTWAGALDNDGRLTDRAPVVLGQAGALLAADAHSGYRLVLTVPAFLTAALPDIVAELGSDSRPLDTVRAMRETAASARGRLQIAAPFLHTGFVGMLASDIERVLDQGGDVQLITRAISPASPQVSDANVDAVALLRDVADSKPGTLSVESWEEWGLGIHFKVVLAWGDPHRRPGPVAYIGSSNPTPGGTLNHAEAGVLAHGPAVELLSRWLDVTARELRARHQTLGF